jgi:uncharacterized protein YfaS (alpha-2-macroglobulin family)
MQTTGNANPELQMQAESYVGTGYQRLLTFEVSGGGFSLFGRPPADVFLSAYGLMEFNDMAQVYPVDDAVIERAAEWLLGQQQPDGTWQAGDYRAGKGALGSTGYVAWALIEAGFEDTSEVVQAIGYIRDQAMQEKDAYSLALAANALAAYDPKDPITRQVIEMLYAMRVQDGDTVYWQMGDASFMGATGESGSVETTALAAYALMRAGAHLDAAQGALGYLIQAKDSWGTWGSTQATILSLKALLLSSELEGRATGAATVRVSLNHELTQEIVIDESNADVVHLVTFDRGFAPTGGDEVQLEVEGGGNLMYQVTTQYYLPWDRVPPTPPEEEPITIDLAYDRTELAVNDVVTVDVRVQLHKKGVVKMALIDLGVPPGFAPLTEDLGQLVEMGLIARYELTGRQVIIYLEDLAYGMPLTFSYRLRARFPMRAQTPPSSAYDYYNPESPAIREPLLLTVEEGQL